MEPNRDAEVSDGPATLVARAGALAAGAVGVFLVLPWAITSAGSALDRALALPVPGGHIAVAAGILLTLAGVAVAAWAVVVQLAWGRGTPVPVVPPRRLVVRGPYAYCRNPMAAGSVVAYLGLAAILRSPGAVAVALGVGAALLAYIKLVEEPGLEARFGGPYRVYRRSTPFVIPRRRRPE